MSKSEKRQSEAFAARLRDLMRARGLVSSTSRSGVDVSALAHAAGASYEMARRYAEGSALPRAETVEALARWLGVSPGVLMWGEEVARAEVDVEVLEQCIAAVSAAQKRTGKTISTEQAARVVAVLYRQAKAGRIPATESIELILEAI